MLTETEKKDNFSLNATRNKTLRDNYKCVSVIIVYNEASEDVVCDELFSTNEERTTPVTVQIANGMSVAISRRGFAELKVKGPETVFFKAYDKPEIR